MQNNPASTLHKLRFMQKNDYEVEKPTKVVERLLDEDTIWVAEGFEEVHKANNVTEAASNKNLRIRYTSRKSFNGANPFIERYMQAIRKRR